MLLQHKLRHNEQYISHIAVFANMFISHKDDLIPSFWEDSLNFSGVELISFSPWFMCEVPQFERGSLNAAFRSTHLIGDVINLYHFAMKHQIEKTYILTPAQLNKTESWSINRLKSISKAIYETEDYANVVYRFETEMGEFFDHVIEDFEANFLNLKFDIFLKFN